MQTIPSVTKKLFTSANGVNMKRVIIPLVLALSTVIAAQELERFPYSVPHKNQEHITKKLEDLYEAFWIYRQCTNLLPAYTQTVQERNKLKICVKTSKEHQNQVELMLSSLQQSTKLLLLTYQSLHLDVSMILARNKVSPIEFLGLYDDQTQNEIPILNSVMQIMSDCDPEKKNGLAVIASLSKLYCSCRSTLRYETPLDNLCL